MIKMLLLILFVYIFFFLHFLRRILGQVYFWQMKGYSCEKIKSVLFKKADIKTYKETFIALMLLLWSLLLIKYIQQTFLFFVLFLGFGYFVYSSLNFLTGLFNKKNQGLAKNLRNIILIIIPIFVSFIPLLFSWYLYTNYSKESGNEVNLVPSGDVELVSFLPGEENGVEVIPLETLCIVFLFAFLFLVDLFLPVFISFVIAITAIFFPAKNSQRTHLNST